MEERAARGNANAIGGSHGGGGLETMLRESFVRTDVLLRSAVWFADGLSMDSLQVAGDLARHMRFLRTVHGVRYLALSFVESLSQHFVNACTRSEFNRYLQRACPAKPAAWHWGMGELFDACRHNGVTIVALANVQAVSVEATAAWWNNMIHLFIPPRQTYVGYTGDAECEYAAAAMVGPRGGFDRYVPSCADTRHLDYPNIPATVTYRPLQWKSNHRSSGSRRELPGAYRLPVP